MSKHTPGPWTAEQDGVKWLVNAAHFGVATCDGPFVNQKHDAKLIAAAPELLEALKEIAIGYSGVAGRNLQSYSKTDCREIARAAIAKAES